MQSGDGVQKQHQILDQFLRELQAKRENEANPQLASDLISPNYGRNFENYARNFENYARNFENSGDFLSANLESVVLPNGSPVPLSADDIRKLARSRR